jgi:uncharacterized membrane protein
VNSWKVIVATVVIFAAGVMTGGLLVNYVQHSHPRNNHRQQADGEAHPPAEAHESPSHTNNLANLPRPRPPEILGDKFVQQLDDALQLTPDQRASIQKIIADGQERNHSIWTNSSAQMREVIQDVRHRVREILNTDQQKQFEELMRRVPRRQNPTNAPTSLPTSLTGSNLSPEAQVIMIETEQLKARQRTNAANNIFPPPLPAPPPAPVN